MQMSPEKLPFTPFLFRPPPPWTTTQQTSSLEEGKKKAGRSGFGGVLQFTDGNSCAENTNVFITYLLTEALGGPRMTPGVILPHVILKAHW